MGVATDSGAALSAPVHDRVVAACARLDTIRARRLVEQGGVPQVCYCVTRGLIELVATTEQGDDVVADVLGPGEWFGFSEALAACRSPLGARTIGAASLLVLRRGELASLMARHAELQDWLRGLAIARSERMATRLAMLATQPIEARLSWLLERHGDEIWRSGLTQTDLGRLVGASRQRVNEALARVRGRTRH